MMCPDCGLDPCACEYIEQLRPGGRLHYLADAALANWDRPLPHLSALDHPAGKSGRAASSCPCPGCYSARLTWTTKPKET